MPYSFPITDPTQKDVLTYDFTAQLETGESLNTPSISVEVLSGSDPAAATKFGTAQVSGANVLVPFLVGLVADCQYHVKVTCTTSNPNKIVAFGYDLPCKNL